MRLAADGMLILAWILVLQGYYQYKISRADSLKDLNHIFDYSWFYILFILVLMAAVLILLHLLEKKRVLEREKRAVDILLQKLGHEEMELKEGPYYVLENEMNKYIRTSRHNRESYEKQQRFYAASLEQIAHQMKTPLTSLSLKLQKYPEPCCDCQPQIKAMEEYISTLLMTSRLDADAVVFDKKSIDVFTLLQIATDILQPQIAEKSLEIVLENHMAWFEGDMEWSLEAIANILKNCIEHSPPGAKVILEYEQNTLYTEIRIRDEGDGFSREEIRHLFERYYQGPQAPDTSTGIGLSIAKDLIEKQNGTIEAVNQNGACFILHFYHCH